MRILIVGAGITGLTLASFLRRHEGFEVTIIEKEKDWSHIGFTIGIWDLGRRILARLDLDDEFDRLSRRIHSFFLSNAKGDMLKLYHFEEFYNKYESAYSHISRTALHQMLLRASGIDVQMNMTVESIVQKDDHVEVAFSDDTKKNFDLVVGADGVYSSVRKMIFGICAQPTGNRTWYAWIPSRFGKEASAIEIISGSYICNIFDDPKQRCMVLTAPQMPNGNDDPETRMDRLRSHFKNFRVVQEILHGLKAEDFTSTDIQFVRMDEWTKDRVVLIGDAAHAMEPFGGIGASMGMEDAYVLAEELCSLHDYADMHLALERYSRRRMPRVDFAARCTRKRHWWLSSRILSFFHLRKSLIRIAPVSHFTKGYTYLLETQP